MNQDARRPHLRQTVEAPAASKLAEAVASSPAEPREYSRPDIVLLGSIRGAVEQMRAELKVVGDERTYLQSLRVIRTQSQLAARLADALIVRFEKAGEE